MCNTYTANKELLLGIEKKKTRWASDMTSHATEVGTRTAH